MSLSAVMGTSSAPSAMGAVVGARGLDSPTYVFTIGGTEQFEEKLESAQVHADCMLIAS
jgi:hypothetical protein